MNIRMYDCGFGDCFQIDTETDSYPFNSRLIVDCGWKRNSRVYDELQTANQSRLPLSFLLTHYHEDHLRGFCDMIQSKQPKDWLQFDHIYIPDIWDVDSDVELVALLLLSELRSGKICLIQFLIDLLKTNGWCHFLKKGDFIEEKYEILWPCKDVVSGNAKADLRKFWNNKDDSDMPIAIMDLASELITIVQKWNGMYLSEDSQLSRGELERIRKQQLLLSHDESFLKGTKKHFRLSPYGNKVSIVFQTKSMDPGLPHVLFTGDVPSKFWEHMKNDLACQFDAIKIPHHGTKAYYWGQLFNHCADPTLIMIPNGDGGGHGWNIDDRYPSQQISSAGKLENVCFNNTACPLASSQQCVCTSIGCISVLNPQKPYIDFLL